MCKPRSIRVLSLFFFNWGMFFPPLWRLRGRWSSYLVLNTDQTFFNSASSLIFMISFLFVWFLFSSNGLIVSLLVGMQGQIIRQPISEQYEITREQVPIKMEQTGRLKHAAARWAHSELFFRLLLKNTVCAPQSAAYAYFWRVLFLVGSTLTEQFKDLLTLNKLS